MKLKKKLNKKTCLYFFEFAKEEAEQILFSYNEYKELKIRNTSAIKRTPFVESNILYVGKVKKNLGGRLSTHFGYANKETGGLQLRHWINKKLMLNVHIIAFDEDIGNFVNPLELELTRVLNPLIGKSK